MLGLPPFPSAVQGSIVLGASSHPMNCSRQFFFFPTRTTNC